MYRFNVQYYNDEHKRLLERYSCAHAIENMVKNGFTVPKEEFRSYSLFREQKNDDGFRTYQELRLKVRSRFEIFNDYFLDDNGLLYSKYIDSNKREKTQTEVIGVGATLVLVSQLYGLTEADWERIPESNKKDLDFEIASNGCEYIEVEAKGAVVQNINNKSEVSGRAEHIRNKKSEKVKRSNGNSSRIGVIVSVSGKRSTTNNSVI